MAREIEFDTAPHGREADGVFGIPFQGWKEILQRTLAEIGKDNISLIAGGATFFLLLAIFPALAAFVALYGLLVDPTTVQEHVAALQGVMPGAAVELIGAELERLASQPSNSLGIGFVFGLLVSLWSANAGVKALFGALNVVYDEDEKRSFVKLTLISLVFTVLAIIGAVILLAAIVVVPAALGSLGLSNTAEWLISILRWPALLVVITLGMGLLYKYGASRRPPRWTWIAFGTALTGILWIVTSALFSFYLANFANYNATYGSLGAVIGFMMWLYVSLMIVLAGAELNAEIEHQVEQDTTVGPARPMGERYAVKADTLPYQSPREGRR